MAGQVFYEGVVEDRHDNLMLGRCRVRVIGVHTENKLELPTEGLPWAVPIQSITSGAMNGIGESPTGLVEGTWVVVIFADTAFQQPRIIGSIGGIPTSLTNEFDGNESDIKVVGQSKSDSDVFPSDITPSDIGGASGKTSDQTKKSIIPNLSTISSIAGKVTSLLGVDTSALNGFLANITGTSGGVLVDSSGAPVLTSDGSPVSTGTGVVDTSVATTVPTATAITNNQQTKAKQTYEVKKNTIMWKLGQTSAEFESGKNGPSAINDYLGSAAYDPGGASYGSYQFASYLPTEITAGAKKGQLREKRRPSPVEQYISQSRFKAKFVGLVPATPAFDAMWKNLASSYAAEFGDEQHEYVKKVYYDPVIAKLKARGINLTDNGPAVQDAIWSTSVQYWHGRCIALVVDAIGAAKAVSDTDFVKQVYDLKLSRFSGEANRIKKEQAKLNQLIASGATKDNLAIGSSTASGTSGVAQMDTSVAKIDTSDPKTFDVAKENVTNIRKANELGFVDPNGVYPSKDMLNEPDTNRLARGEKIIDTIVGKKEKNRLEGVAVALAGQNWSQPHIPYAATYPFNQVKQTESGHVLEFDDTDGAERIHLYHKTGSFTEIDNTGSEVHRIVGDGYHITDRNGHIYIGGRCNITVAADCNLYVYGDLNAEVEGDANIVSYNDIEVKASGNMNLSCQETMTLKANDIIIDSDTSISNTAATIFNVKAGTDTNITSGGNYDTTTIGTSNIKTGIMNTSVDNDYSLTTGGKVRESIGGPRYSHVGGDDAVRTDGNIQMISGAAFNIDTTGSFNYDMGMAVVPDNEAVAAVAAAIGEKASFGVPSTARFDTSGTPDFENLVATSRIDNAIMTYETPEDTASPEYESFKAKSIASGRSEIGDYEKKGIEMEKDNTPTVVPKELVKPQGDVFKSMNTFPDNLRLSPNFTLGQLSSNAVVSKYKVQDQFGLTAADVVTNLQNLATNVLEPIIKEFPGVFVTSGFRHNNSVSGRVSDHVLGQAVDIQFRNTNMDYFDISKKLKGKFPFKQFLLEYRENKGRPTSIWLHISLCVDPAKNLGQVMTLFNDKKHDDGFAKLA